MSEIYFLTCAAKRPSSLNFMAREPMDNKLNCYMLYFIYVFGLGGGGNEVGGEGYQYRSCIIDSFYRYKIPTKERLFKCLL